tara:strand:+ start:1965 stop:2885 length:921 start_codon:yes stop_codon:yes gene_type:complete
VPDAMAGIQQKEFRMLKKRFFPRPAAALAIFSALLTATLAAAADDFDLLVYNTHGLPGWIAGDDPEARFPVIGGHADRYDLTLLQEDFKHHEKLLEGTGASVVVRGSNSRMPWCALCSGDGLTTISRLPKNWQPEIDKYAFDTCSGWLTGANDCLATKGFQLLRLTTPQGGRLFVVNTHMDAGDGDGDRKARQAQLETIRAVIEREVADHALIVAGDLNLDADNPLDRALLDSFMQNLGLVDSGAHPTSPTNWEILDYILVRSGPNVRVTVREAGEDLALIHNGTPLSDHPALFARFSLQPTDPTP